MASESTCYSFNKLLEFREFKRVVSGTGGYDSLHGMLERELQRIDEDVKIVLGCKPRSAETVKAVKLERYTALSRS